MAASISRDRDFQYNPMGCKGFSFVEFVSSEPEKLTELFTQLGFHYLGKHTHKPLHWYQQGNIKFLVSQGDERFSHNFSKAHGPSACAMGFQVESTHQALKYAKKHRARICRKRLLELQVGAIFGIGDSLLYLVDEQAEHALFDKYLDTNKSASQTSAGLMEIDHLTHNVYRGHMDDWANFYESIFNFHEIRFFDIRGVVTGLVSRALTSPCGNIRIPINESTDDQSQIEEYLQEYHGEGIQHIALHTDDIYSTVNNLRNNGIDFMDVPDTYYDMLEERLPGHGEPIDQLRDLKILVDGHKEEGEWKLLLQIFTKNVIGPIFFEIIQRKGDQGFGEGNFQALFESIERDQIERGVVKLKK